MKMSIKNILLSLTVFLANTFLIVSIGVLTMDYLDRYNTKKLLQKQGIETMAAVIDVDDFRSRIGSEDYRVIYSYQVKSKNNEIITLKKEQEVNHGVHYSASREDSVKIHYLKETPTISDPIKNIDYWWYFIGMVVLDSFIALFYIMAMIVLIWEYFRQKKLGNI